MKLNSEALQQYMQEKGIKSLSALAQKAGVHRNTLYPLVRGETSPVSESFLSVCKALEVSPAKLIKDETDENLAFIKSALEVILSNNMSQRGNYAFFLYGSRAKESARQFSDYDIGLTGGEMPVHWRDYLNIKEDLSNACDDLPVKVSLLNFDDAPESFLDDFESPMIFLKGNKGSFDFFKGFLHGRAKKKKIQRCAP